MNSPVAFKKYFVKIYSWLPLIYIFATNAKLSIKIIVIGVWQKTLKSAHLHFTLIYPHLNVSILNTLISSKTNPLQILNPSRIVGGNV
jgi:hypothetical protein